MSPAGRLSKMTHDGKWIAQVERLGYVPPCVRDAFSWLPHPFAWHKKELIWFWLARVDDRSDAGHAPAIQAPSSARCQTCVFQEPPWSQGYAGCSHSHLNDADGDCQAFLDRPYVLAEAPTYAKFCGPPRMEGVCEYPYRQDGTLWSSFQPTLNFPSAYIARLNHPEWWASGAHSMYGPVQRERFRRFKQWIKQLTIKSLGAYQPQLPL